MSTVGLNDQTVAKYIREQEGHDIAMDKLSVNGTTSRKSTSQTEIFHLA